MRLALWMIALTLSVAGPAVAQTYPSPSGSTAEGITPDGTALKAGANSFAEGQARKLLQSHGYDDVSPLVNDRSGIWRGTATKDGKPVHVSVDYKGHIDER